MLAKHGKSMDKNSPFGRVVSSFDFCQIEWAFSCQVLVIFRQEAMPGNELPIRSSGIRDAIFAVPQDVCGLIG
jgi:hypothetical protein